MVYEYSVVPAPKKGIKAKGVKSAEDRFAHALQEIMNGKGAEGWEYIRTDTLPAEERSGLTGRTTTYQNMMVFRRSPVAFVETKAPSPALLAAPVPDTPDVAGDEGLYTQEPTFSSRSDDRGMSAEPAPVDDDPLRADPKLRAD